MSLAPGSVVEVRMTKWGERPHWSFSCTYLGADEHGDWLGIPAGTVMVRPGARYVAPNQQLGLVPAAGLPDSVRGWLATFHGPGGPLSVYVDVTVPPIWSGSTLHTCDLDLDVVRELDGRVWVDDEDEFALHQVAFSYPDDVIAAARASADRLVALIGAERAPFDGTPAPWFARLDALLRG